MTTANTEIQSHKPKAEGADRRNQLIYIGDTEIELFKMERRKYGLFTNVNDRILD
jgi:hypothetical protein